MRYWTLSSCLVGVLALGCGRSSAPPAVRVVAADPGAGDAAESGSGENSAAEESELPPYHGRAGQADLGTGPQVRLGGLTLTAPAGWKRVKPGSAYYLAEFALPHGEKDATDGRVTISSGIGPVGTNVDVFEGEFDTPAEQAKHEKKEIAGLAVTFVDISGQYIGQHGPSAPAAARDDYRMILAVIQQDGQLFFVKALGPQQTMAARAEEVRAFVGSLQRGDGDRSPAAEATGTGAEVRVEPLTLTAPATWKRTKPRSSLVHAEFMLPRVEKDGVDGRLTVSVVTGTVQDNVDRWKGQFVGAVKSARQEEREVAGLQATLVDVAGTFGEQAGMVGPLVNRPDYRMIGIIIPMGDQLFVIKAVGPEQTLTAQVEAINSFVASLKRDD